jgi:hypothetical protein
VDFTAHVLNRVVDETVLARYPAKREIIIFQFHALDSLPRSAFKNGLTAYLLRLGAGIRRHDLVKGLTHMDPIYRIKDWAKHYENNRTREMSVMRWVPIPNKHDGDGYTALVDRPNGAAMLGCWLVVAQIASKCGIRGTLLRDNAEPHTAASISRLTRLPQAEIQSLLILASSSEIGWLEVVDNKGVVIFPQEGAGFPQSTDEGKEGKGIEGKGSIFVAAPPRAQRPQKQKLACNIIPPPIDAVIAFGARMAMPEDECRKFFDHFESNGWRVGGKAAMKNWNSALTNWHRNYRAGTFSGDKNGKPKQNSLESANERRAAQRAGEYHDPALDVA